MGPAQNGIRRIEGKLVAVFKHADTLIDVPEGGTGETPALPVYVGDLRKCAAGKGHEALAVFLDRGGFITDKFGQLLDVRSKVVIDTPSIVPTNGHITSLFGWRRSPFGFGRDFHTGIDIAAPEGTPVYATAPGEVVCAGWSGGYGNLVRVKHKYGFETLYGHNSRIAVHMGQIIQKGQVVAYVGATGSATGNHTHYEIRLGGVAINPYPYMSKMW